MADSNPTDDGPALVLQIPAGNPPFLRLLFTAGRDGLREDLSDFVGELREPARRLREEAVYGQLLAAVDGAPLCLDHELVEALSHLAEAIDRENEYARVVAGHDALHGLLGEIKGALL